jgi:hypothetical protein
MMITLRNKHSGPKIGVLVPLSLLLFGAQAGATVVNLTTAGSSGTINDAIYEQIEPRATGTGVIDSFVRISDANGDVVEGFNTDDRPLDFDENNSPFTHALTVGDVPIVNIGGTDYRQFMLDINQLGSDPLLSLFELQIYLRSIDAADGQGTNSDTAAGFSGFLGASTLIYDMDAGVADGDSYVNLNYNLNTGSGSGDMFLYVLSSLFGDDNSKFVVLYSAFGIPHNNNDGFEEWAVQEGTVPIPEPTSIALFGTVLVGVGFLLRKKIAVV